MAFIANTPAVLPIKNTSAVLIATNPILLYGQIALETDTNRTKSGDGTSTYTQLTYAEWAYEIVEAAGTDTYTGTFSSPFFLAYFPMMRIRVRFTNANTGASTINLNGLGAKAIKKAVSSALAVGDILAGGIYELVYDGTNFQILNVSATGGGGTVTSVSGTAFRITSTGGATPVIDIAATYVGQASITTLGTITTGVWNGTLVGLAYGGTNKNMTAVNGGVVWTDADSMEVTAAGTTGQMLRSAGAASPIWSTATFPATATTTGAYLRADGTNWITSTLILPNAAGAGEILYATSANTIGSASDFVRLSTGEVGIGVAVPTFQLTTNFTTAATTNVQSSYLLKTTSTGNMASTFGGGMLFGVQDNAGVENLIAGISGAMTTADNTGDLFFRTASAGSLTEKVRITAAGLLLSLGSTIMGGANTLLASEILSIQKSQNASTDLYIYNATSGTAGRSAIEIYNSASAGLLMRSYSALYTTSGMNIQNAASILCNSSAGLNIGTTGATTFDLWTNNTRKIRIPSAGGLVIGTAALATNTTDGFLYIPTCAGTPSGTPTTQTGTVAMIYDTTNNKMYVYNGAWKGGTAPGAWS